LTSEIAHSSFYSAQIPIITPSHSGGLKGGFMSTTASRLEIVQEEAQAEWFRLLSTDLTPRNGLKRFAMRLMTLEIIDDDVDDDDLIHYISVPFSCDPGERLDQVQNSWMEKSAGRTVPAGIIFARVDDEGPADVVQFVALQAVAEISRVEVERLTTFLSFNAEITAAGVRQRGGEGDVIIDT
jgi:hypothetical protein